MSGPKVAVAATGVANLASVLAAFRRCGAAPEATDDADALADADLAVLPGVGAFGPAMEALRAKGLDRAFADRWRRRAPSLGVCLGMQLFFEASEESPGARGLGILPGVAGRIKGALPLPQLGWNRVFAQSAKTSEQSANASELRSGKYKALREGWAYFANSYRLAEAPEGCRAMAVDYGERFVAALEAGESAGGRPALLLCQFHPELSGAWGAELLSRWLGLGPGRES